MGLRHLVLPIVKVAFPGGDFAVRGMSVDMLIGLYNRHRGIFASMFDDIAARATAKDKQDVAAIVATVAQAAPSLLAEAIAISAGGDPNADHVDTDTTVNPEGRTDWERDVAFARSLSFPVQVDAFEKIAEQTFTSDMPPGKLLAVVLKLAGNTAAALPSPSD